MKTGNATCFGQVDIPGSARGPFSPALSGAERVAAAIGNLADEFWQEGESGASYGGKAVAERLHMLRQELAAAPASDAERVAAARETLGAETREFCDKLLKIAGEGIGLHLSPQAMLACVMANVRRGAQGKPPPPDATDDAHAAANAAAPEARDEGH